MDAKNNFHYKLYTKKGHLTLTTTMNQLLRTSSMIVLIFIRLDVKYAPSLERKICGYQMS